MLTSHSAATERKEVWRGQEKRKNTGLLKCGVDDLRTFTPGYGPPQWLKGKESACNAGDVGLILGLGRSPGGGHGNALQCSCLENPMDRGAWQATVHWVTKSWTQPKQLSTRQHM